jgi:hypothetical protein
MSRQARHRVHSHRESPCFTIRHDVNALDKQAFQRPTPSFQADIQVALSKPILQFRSFRFVLSVCPATGILGVVHGQIYTPLCLVLSNNANAGVFSQRLSCVF